MSVERQDTAHEKIKTSCSLPPQTGFYRRGRRHIKQRACLFSQLSWLLEASKSLLITGSGYSGLNYLLADNWLRSLWGILGTMNMHNMFFSVGRMSRVKREDTQASPTPPCLHACLQCSSMFLIVSWPIWAALFGWKNMTYLYIFLGQIDIYWK